MRTRCEFTVLFVWFYVSACQAWPTYKVSGQLIDENPPPTRANTAGNPVDIKFKTTSGAEVVFNPHEVGHALILDGDTVLSKLKLLGAARTAPEFLVPLLYQAAGVTLDAEQKQAVFAVLADPPEGATSQSRSVGDSLLLGSAAGFARRFSPKKRNS